MAAESEAPAFRARVAGATEWIASLAARTAALSGWRRYVWAATLGTLATLALPPVYLLPALYIAFTGLVWLLPAGLRPRAAFLTGWWFGMGYFVTGLYWIGFAPVTFSMSLIWVVPFAAVGVPILLSIFHGIATLAAVRVGGGHLARVLAVGLAWGITEWLRGQVLTGFPWNLAGYAWIGSDALAQTAALAGMYGLTLLAVIAAAMPAAFAENAERRRWIALAVAFGLPLAGWAGGTVRLGSAPALGTDIVPGVGLRLVQANIPQNEKWARSLQRRNLDLHRNLSIADRPDWITHVVWPETAATFDPTRSEAGRRTIAAVAPAGGLVLTGAPRHADRPRRIWNAMVAIDANGDITATFDKFHLVPFGEYMPMRSILPFDKLTPGAVDFSPGPGPRTLRLAGLPPVSPLICYEVIFPGEVTDPDDRPSWLLNLTNDAWYGLTAGPHQHLAIARMRAVEEGMPLIRSANTGISAAFDAYGREVARLGLGVQGFRDLRLPSAASPTLYARYRELVFLVIIILALLPLLLCRRN